MDEARRVIERLERIESLREAGSGRDALLPELHALLDEAQRWVEGEGAGTDRAAAALDTLEERLQLAVQTSLRPPERGEVVHAESESANGVPRR